MHLLYFWRGDNYRRDLDYGVGFYLNEANPLLHQIRLGESLPAFTWKADGRYALAARLIVSANATNPRGFSLRTVSGLGRSNINTPIRRTRSPCCARAMSRHAAPPMSVMNSPPLQSIELHPPAQSTSGQHTA